MTYEMIRAERQGDVLVLTLNRPERLNAAPPQMFVEIGHALENLDGARAVLITGEGRAFCSGADLAGRDQSQASPADRAKQSLTNSYNPTMLKIANASVPIVSAVNGPAAGIGCSLALAADFCIAGESGYFLQAFVNIGLVPDGGASWMLARLVGKARATEMMLLGERIHGPKAAEWGLVYKCVPDAVLLEEAMTLATRLAAGPTVALGLMRQGLAAALESDYATAMAGEADRQSIAGQTADAVEGAVSFLQKRKAVFKGQ
ncbi:MULTISPECIES: enoyl-CoA hydratase-related protein [unclassified Sphingomonas]|uniref:enoyl-CoA hydratase-related protein n=1 Tax=unclassified Sphingomonas TaxID=196159 RepID=UPI000BD30516|nr:MAG: 2-(1,2-epoxy-1,2-dihydrophenyl)acetyl-CoA isomerase [Sphingomonas sp. 12-62-6]OYX37612.1 MAG: 2-(1,2-epoxy-1,2-dihydrophenyl)acetyl-CoA isomerase [Sphingomonas sp. 32-62-10]